MEDQIALLEKFVSQYDEIVITDYMKDSTIFEIEYGWSDYEESEQIQVSLNLKTFLLTANTSCYSVMEGDYDDTTNMQFVDWNDLYANFCKGIKEYFE